MTDSSIDRIPGHCIRQKLQDIVKNQLRSEDVDISIETGSKEGQNFMGSVYRIKYKKSFESDENNEKSLILKITSSFQMAEERAKVRNTFLREILLYSQIFPLYNEIQISKGIDLNIDGFNEYPKYYGSVSEDLSEALFLEDLKVRQFEVIDLRDEPLSFEHVSLLMKALGKFHGMSFALRDQQPEKFNQLKIQVNELFWIMLESDLTEHYEHMFERIVSCCEDEKRPDLSEKIKQVFGGEDANSRIFELISCRLAEPYSVICHGDPTTNNSMFRKNVERKPIEIQLLDWQCCRYASPVTDLVLYLLCSTTKELRDKHYDDFLKIYHESLSNLLLRLGSDPEKLFPYEALLEQFKKFGRYALFVGIILMPILHADRNSMILPSDSNTFDSENMFLIPEDSRKAYNRIVVDFVDDMIRLGYI